MVSSQRRVLIERTLHTLRSSFRVCAPVDDTALLKYYKSGDYTGMVGFIRNSMHLKLRVRVGKVRSGGPSAPAWVQFNDPMPMFGTKEFAQEIATMFVRGDFLERARFETQVTVFSHEMSHLVLESIRHPLRRLEEAVDLTAMMLGYRDFYVTGCTSTPREQGLAKYRLLRPLVSLFQDEYSKWSIGYLSQEEVQFAAGLMVR